MKILLAVDGSDYTKRMLAWLGTHDDLLARGAQYTFLTVVPALPSHVTRHLNRTVVEDYQRDKANEVLQPINAFARQHGWQFDAQSAVGDPGPTIAQHATRDKFDLVVIGSHGHGAVGSLVLGSVAQRVLANCSVPVLVVR